jgi:hypothetical protein
VIAAGIKTAHIKVPVIIGKDHQVAFNQAPLPAMKFIEQSLFRGKISCHNVGAGRREESKLLVQTN